MRVNSGISSSPAKESFVRVSLTLKAITFLFCLRTLTKNILAKSFNTLGSMLTLKVLAIKFGRTSVKPYVLVLLVEQFYITRHVLDRETKS